MRRTLNIVCSAAVSLTSALVGADSLAAPPAPPAPPADGAILVHGAGRVRIADAADWSPTQVGQVIRAGTIVDASGASPLDFRFPDGIEVTMEPGAVAKWRGRGKLPTEKSTWYYGFHIEQRAGEIDVRVPSQPGGERAFLVSSKAGTLTDWRGSLHVGVQDESTAAAIYEGALVVGSNGTGFPVYDATAVLIRKGGSPERSHGIPSSPAWSAHPPAGTTPPFALVRGNEEPKFGFAWEPVAGAASYRVEVATDPVMVDSFQHATTRDTHFELGSALAGADRYYVRVRAVAATGIVGAWSRPRALRVVRLELPPGAVSAGDGTIILSDDAAVTLHGVDDMEASSETMRVFGGPMAGPFAWGPAPTEVHLGTNAMRIVHLRDAATGGESKLTIVRRELHALVDISPKRARWPQDPVSVRVDVRDPSGRLDPATEPLTFETTVNLAPVPVEWRHAGATWTAKLEPRPAPGPWVVRVTARGSHGEEVGSGFLEVDGPRAPSGSERAPDSTEVKVYH